MVKALSIDLRRRVFAAVDGGMSRNQAAFRFGVSITPVMDKDGGFPNQF